MKLWGLWSQADYHLFTAITASVPHMPIPLFLEVRARWVSLCVQRDSLHHRRRTLKLSICLYRMACTSAGCPQAVGRGGSPWMEINVSRGYRRQASRPCLQPQNVSLSGFHPPLKYKCVPPESWIFLEFYGSCMPINFQDLSLHQIPVKFAQRGVLVAQRLSICLRLRSWSWGPGIKSHIGLLAGSLLLPLCLCLSLCASHE